MSKLYTKQLLKVERNTVLDEELDIGKLSGKNLNLATLISFLFYQCILVIAAYFNSFSVVEYLALTVVSLLLARQTALDFAYHVFLDIYNLPLAIISVILSVYVFGYNSLLVSLVCGMFVFLIFLSFTYICSKILKKPAGIGGGDIKFAFSIGAFLGGIYSYVAIVLSCVFNFILTFFYKDKTNIPMGPGLLLGFWICVLFYDFIATNLIKYLG